MPALAGNLVALLAEDEGSIGKAIGRQLLRTRRNFTATVFSPDGEGATQQEGLARAQGRSSDGASTGGGTLTCGFFLTCLPELHRRLGVL